MVVPVSVLTPNGVDSAGLVFGLEIGLAVGPLAVIRFLGNKQHFKVS
jgi:hypothetical protein